MAHRARRRPGFSASLALLIPLLSGNCISPGDAKPLRYYRAEPPLASAEEAPGAPAPERALRLRHFDAAGHLRERMAVRTSPVEYELRELERWTEPPLAYVQRAIGRALFEHGGLARSEALAAPTLGLELLAFEEVLVPERAAEVALTLNLTGADGTALLDRTVVEREPIAGATPEAAALALAAALERAATESARLVRTALEAQAPAR